MSPSAILKNVKMKYPELRELPAAKLKLVEEALIYAFRISSQEDLLTDREHKELLSRLGTQRITPGSSLKAYRLREQMTQQELSKKSGIPQANLSAMERGHRAIGLKSAKKLAEILGCDYKKLV